MKKHSERQVKICQWTTELDMYLYPIPQIPNMKKEINVVRYTLHLIWNVEKDTGGKVCIQTLHKVYIHISSQILNKQNK